MASKGVNKVAKKRVKKERTCKDWGAKAYRSKERCARHVWGPFVVRSYEDGEYQTCEKCGACRFKGDRYAYGSRW